VGFFVSPYIYYYMKKIIRLTERDLTRIVKRMIKEERVSSDVKKLISILKDNNLIDTETINVYYDHIEVYSIKDNDFPYFEDNFIKLYPNIDEGVVYVEREDYGEEIDEDEYDEVINHIWSDWEEKLGLEFND
jgi:hypothetical protein